MSELSQDSFVVRPAEAGDISGILAMVRELAAFENLEHQLVASEEDYRRNLIDPATDAGALVAETANAGHPVGSGTLIGYAIYFSTFSSFLGKPGLWLEDLYVREAFRGRGAGKALLVAVGKIAHERGCGRYEWSVLDWNHHAISLYQSLGADVMPDWRIARLDRDGLERLVTGAG